MKWRCLVLFFITIFIVTSCSDNQTKYVGPPGWIKKSLPDGWTFFAPTNFICKKLQGIDSHPGYIYSTIDSLMLEFDAGRKMEKNRNCDVKEELSAAQASIDTGFYKSFYKLPTMHNAYVVTIDNKVATIVQPVKIGKGTVGVSISDCVSNTWLGITGENLSPKRQKLALEIYKTIRHTK